MSASESATGRFYIAHVRDATERERLSREREGILSIAQAATSTTSVDDFLHRAADSVTEATDFNGCVVYLHDEARNALVLAASSGFGADYAQNHGQYPLNPDYPSIAVQTWFRRGLIVEEDLQGRTEMPSTADFASKYGYRLIVSAPFGDEKAPWGVFQLLATEGRGPRADDEQLVQILAHELAAVLRQKRLISQLEESAAELRQTNRELDSFIYTASHDLAEPLRSISNFSHFLIEDYADRLDEEGRDYLQRVHNGAGRMKRLLDDLLRLSRHGRSKAPRVRVSPEEVLAEVREGVDATLRERGAELEFASPLPPVVADRTSLLEVFSNLVVNGIKFNDAETPRVTVRARRVDGMVQFDVEDNGIGIAPEHYDRVFGLFTRLHPRRQYPGTGAGLAIVKKIIEMHEGRIWVDSVPQKGSTFHFVLPAAPAGPSGAEVREARAAVP